MSKLHELLAVEGDLEGTFKKIIDETAAVFEKKPALFSGFTKHLEMFSENDPLASTPDEVQELTTTVPDRLDYTADHVIRYFDAVLQKEATNQTARADIVVDGVTIAKDLPATFLLGLEAKLKHLRKIYDAAPTLAPGKKWNRNAELGKHVYVCERPEERFKTAKTFQHKVLYDATEHHPAQIEKWEETENVGKYITTHISGMISPAEKSALIGRLDKLIRAVKKARQRANSVDVQKRTIGKELFAYIRGE